MEITEDKPEIRKFTLKITEKELKILASAISDAIQNTWPGSSMYKYYRTYQAKINLALDS